MLKVGVTGGIGSGKSLVCAMISAMGYPVYNADNQSKIIVETDPYVISAIKNLFGEEIYINGKLNRAKVAEIVFANPPYLEKLNSIVHPAVINHFNQWVDKYQNRRLLVKEAAILFESGANVGLDKIIVVTAPTDIRIKRVQERDNADVASIVRRMNTQMLAEELVSKGDYIIENDGNKLLLPQVVYIIDKILND